MINAVLFKEVIKNHEKRNYKVNLYFSEVGATLRSKYSVYYMRINGVRHNPLYCYISSLPNNEEMMILSDIGWDTTDTLYLDRCEILWQIIIRSEISYQKVAKTSLNGSLNSKGNMDTIKNIGKIEIDANPKKL